MQPLITVKAFSDDLFKALALWEDAVRIELPDDPATEWHLVSTHIMPMMRPVAGLHLVGAGGQQQFETVIAVIGIFQQEDSSFTIANRSVRAGYEMVSGCKEHVYMDGRCMHCGLPQ